MKVEYPNERIAALALEKQYGLDEQQARMIFDLRFRFMFGTARDLVYGMVLRIQAASDNQ